MCRAYTPADGPWLQPRCSSSSCPRCPTPTPPLPPSTCHPSSPQPSPPPPPPPPTPLASPPLASPPAGRLFDSSSSLPPLRCPPCPGLGYLPPPHTTHTHTRHTNLQVRTPWKLTRCPSWLGSAAPQFLAPRPHGTHATRRAHTPRMPHDFPYLAPRPHANTPHAAPTRHARHTSFLTCFWLRAHTPHTTRRSHTPRMPHEFPYLAPRPHANTPHAAPTRHARHTSFPTCLWLRAHTPTRRTSFPTCLWLRAHTPHTPHQFLAPRPHGTHATHRAHTPRMPHEFPYLAPRPHANTPHAAPTRHARHTSFPTCFWLRAHTPHTSHEFLAPRPHATHATRRAHTPRTPHEFPYLFLAPRPHATHATRRAHTPRMPHEFPYLAPRPHATRHLTGFHPNLPGWTTFLAGTVTTNASGFEPSD